GLTWLHYAVFTSSLGLATSLVNINFPINVQNEKGQTPLWISCLSGNYEMSSFLLSQDADASIESDGGSSPLHHLAVFEDAHAEKIALMLLEHGANVNGRNAAGYTPLHYAVRGSGNLEEGPGAINSAFGRSSMTPLHLAAAFGNVTAVKILLRRGANPFAKSASGSTPL
ncbi:ankyrin, partial [Thozetella sp. PMI_491]